MFNDGSIKGFFSRPAAVFGLVSAFALMAYSGSFQGAFFHDDFHQLVNNPHIRDLRNLPDYFTQGGMGTYYKWLKGYRPIVLSSFALNYALSGYKVFGYHLFNFIVHILNAFLVYMVVVKVLKQAGDEEPYYIPLLVSLAFALHPVQTGAVTYISGRAVLLSSFFYLTALYAFLNFRGGQAQGASRRFWYALAPLSYFLGLMSKEMAISLPALLLAYDLIFTFPKRRGLYGYLKTGLHYLPILAVPAAYLFVRKSILGYASIRRFDYGVGEYLLTQAKVLLIYLRLLVLPVNQNADYDLPAVKSLDAVTVVSAALVVFAVFVLYRARKGLPALSFFGYWFLITLAPESSLIPIKDVAVEYRVYLPSIGFIAAGLLTADVLLKRLPEKRILAASVLLLFGILTFNRNSVWSSESALLRDAARKSPHSARVHCNLGKALLYEGRYDEAITELMRSMEIDPDYSETFVTRRNLGMCYYYTGRYTEAEEELKKALSERPDDADYYVCLGMVYEAQGRYREALDVLHKGQSVDPESASVHFYLSKVYLLMGDKKAALTGMLEALRLSPRDFRINYALANIYYENNLYDKAVERAQRALELSGDGPQRDLAKALVERLHNLNSPL